MLIKAAALMAAPVNNHPFIDGNKRVGITAAALFLARNGRRLSATNPQVEQFALAVAQNQLDIAGMASWFADYTEPT